MQSRPRASLKGGLCNHIRGQVRNAAAKPRPGMEPDITLVDRIETCDARFKDALRARGKKPGPKPKPAFEIVFGGPRVDTGPWDLDQALNWARQCVPFLERRLGPECIALAVLHTDEGSWHCHVLISCCVPGMPMGVDSVRTRLSAGYAERVRLKGRHRRAARGIVDAYHAEVGRRWGFIEPERAVNVLPRTVDVSLARRLRIQDQIEIAESQLHEAEEAQAMTAVEDPGDRVAAEAARAWTHRLRSLREALKTGDLSVIDYSGDPVPGYSATAWARRIEELEQERSRREEMDAEEAWVDAQIESAGDGGVPDSEADADAAYDPGAAAYRRRNGNDPAPQ